LKESLAFTNTDWKYIFDVYNEPLFLLDHQYNIIDCNVKAVEVYGYIKEELLRMSLQSIRSPFSGEEIERAMNISIDVQGLVFETRHLKKDKTDFPVEVSAKPFLLDNRLKYILFVRDISLRKRAEERLAASEKRYRDLVDYSPVTIFIQCDNKILFINPAGIKFFGAIDEEEIIGRSIFEFIHPDYHKLAAHRVNLLREGMAVPIIEEKILKFDGSIADVEVTAKPIRYLGEPSVEVFMHDITLRKKSEESNAFLASIVEFTDDAVVSTTLDGYVRSWNKGAEQLYGYSSTEMQFAPYSIIVPPILENEVPKLLDRIRNGERINHYETMRVRKDGRLINVSAIISPVKNREGEIICASSITHQI